MTNDKAESQMLRFLFFSQLFASEVKSLAGAPKFWPKFKSPGFHFGSVAVKMRLAWFFRAHATAKKHTNLPFFVGYFASFLFGFSIRQFRVEFSLWIDQVLASFHVWPFANAATGH